MQIKTLINYWGCLMFSKNDAIRLIQEMRMNYGSKFLDMWKGVDLNDLASHIAEKLRDITPQDFMRGLQKMEQSTFCPTIPEFKSWCMPKADVWLDAHEAWATAKNSIDFMTGSELTVVWTEQSAKAFAKCADLVRTGDKYQLAEAKKIFVSIYERLVVEAKDQNLQPIYNVSLGIDPDQRIQAIQEAELAGLLTHEQTALQLEHKRSTDDMRKDEQRYKTIAQEHLAKLKALVKPKAPTQEAFKEQLTASIFKRPDEWLDPFDQRDQYIAELKSQNKSVPLMLEMQA